MELHEGTDCLWTERSSAGQGDLPGLDIPPAPDWIEWGGQLIFAVDFTSGGAPVCLTLDDVDETLNLESLERLRHSTASWPELPEIAAQVDRCEDRFGLFGSLPPPGGIGTVVEPDISQTPHLGGCHVNARGLP